MCLNNWHYINEKILTFHNEINFFTGHSGSGKSTVLDALQIVLYAETNGRGFFNKAAKEDSDRSLIEYLRGMKVVQENNDISYLRNKNFSTTIVLEFEDTETHKYQSIGVIFDVDVSVNDISRLFFWHTGELAPNHYREGDKVMSISELKGYLQENYSKEEYYVSRTNEKFRNELYSTYFGGLHPKHFPALFKKAIPFKMDMKLEDFVKNYICTENDIHMEDMQDSVAQYTRLKRRLEDTKAEIALLTEIKEQYSRYDNLSNRIVQYQYNLDQLDIKTIETKLEKLGIQQVEYQEDIKIFDKSISDLEEEIKALQVQRDEVTYSIQNSGYEHLEAELKSICQMIELLNRSKAAYERYAKGLALWLSTEFFEPSEKVLVEHFIEYNVTRGEMIKIKSILFGLKKEFEREKGELSGKINELKHKLFGIAEQMELLKKGQKAYPHYLLEVKDYITRELEQEYEIPVRVDILADVIEVTNEQWLNAVEGYMGNNKLNLIVPPAYAKRAMELYKELDSKKYYKVAVIDTERVLDGARPILQNSLAEEVVSNSDYIKAYIDYLMGAVIKCGSIEELRNNKSGITADCVLYQGYKLQHINPRNYTEEAYIGHSAIERRLHLLEQNRRELQSIKSPMDQRLYKLVELLTYEYLTDEVEVYESLLGELHQIHKMEAQKAEHHRKIDELKKLNVDEWKAKKVLLEQIIQGKSKQKEDASVDLRSKEKMLKEFAETIINLNEELIGKQQSLSNDAVHEEAYQSFIKEQGDKKTESIRMDLINQKQSSEKQMEDEYDKLVRKREQYHGSYAYRGFSLTDKHNAEYAQLLENLSSDKLNEFSQKANEQAILAIHHFKSDFIYKIRDAIKEVMQQKEDLNRILAQLDFGKDKYKFIISKNRGEDGKFYEMFMDENLEINPAQLTGNINNQMDMFSMQHEKDYSDLINELIELFMPPENSDSKALEEARANMEKYADYRTYLSFDMEQLVEGMPPMRLSKMLSKNSGGEGQNPLYVALLASFAQIYRINLKSNIRRRPTPRLVVLDEAFSKMDAEKVGSCIGLIRKLGFQAIISATNDKIQNYVDNVDKTFVYANPNKNRISVQEFEKKEFLELLLASQEEENDDSD
jgi:uncharacterized protein YPO0396